MEVPSSHALAVREEIRHQISSIVLAEPTSASREQGVERVDEAVDSIMQAAGRHVNEIDVPGLRTAILAEAASALSLRAFGLVCDIQCRQRPAETQGLELGEPLFDSLNFTEVPKKMRPGTVLRSMVVAAGRVESPIRQQPFETNLGPVNSRLYINGVVAAVKPTRYVERAYRNRGNTRSLGIQGQVLPKGWGVSEMSLFVERELRPDGTRITTSDLPSASVALRFDGMPQTMSHNASRPIGEQIAQLDWRACSPITFKHELDELSHLLNPDGNLPAPGTRVVQRLCES